MAFSVVYTRVSTDEQAKTGQSLASQEKACIEFSERSGYEVLEVFREEGASAKSINRTELARMLNYCKDNKGKVDAVVVWKVDRFARRAEDHLMLKTVLARLNIKLHSVTEPIEDTNTGRLMETILAGFAQFDNEVRAERSINGLRARIDQGGWVTYAPLGYKNAKDSLGRPTLEIVPDIAKLVSKLFEEFSKGTFTQKQITEYAFKLGLRSRQSGGKLTLQAVSNLLRNVAYIGRRLDKSTQQTTKALHRPIVSAETFHEVQAVLNGKSKQLRQPKDEDWPLRAGFVICAVCTSPLTGSSPKGRKKYYPKYSCPTCRKSLTGKSVSVDRNKLHDEFQELLVRIRPKDRNLALFRRIVLLRWNQEYKEIASEKNHVEKDLAALQKRRERVLDLYIDQKLPDEDKDSQLQKIDTDRAVLRVQLAELQKEVNDRELIIDVAIDFMQNVARYWDQAPLELQRRFQYLVFPEGIAYDFEKGFRTAKLGESYEVMGQLESNNSSVVGVDGIEPSTKRL